MELKCNGECTASEKGKFVKRKTKKTKFIRGQTIESEEIADNRAEGDSMAEKTHGFAEFSFDFSKQNNSICFRINQNGISSLSLLLLNDRQFYLLWIIFVFFITLLILKRIKFQLNRIHRCCAEIECTIKSNILQHSSKSISKLIGNENKLRPFWCVGILIQAKRARTQLKFECFVLHSIATWRCCCQVCVRSCICAKVTFFFLAKCYWDWSPFIDCVTSNRNSLHCGRTNKIGRKLHRRQIKQR